MRRPLRVTFYSFKGGVGRTLALLDVAVILARLGQKVAIVNMDLEAPGFHRFPAIRPTSDDQPGISDYVFERLTRVELAVEPYTYRPEVPGIGDNLIVVPAGRRPRELAEYIPRLYRPLTARSLVFQAFVQRLADTFEPDFVFFDSRTGLAEIAAICTVELADVVIALSGLNPQGVDGLASVIERIRHHPARTEPPAFILAYSPIPRFDDLSLDRLGHVRAVDGVDAKVVTHPLVTRIVEAHRALWQLAIGGDEKEIRRRYPKLSGWERLHFLRYDPWVPVLGEADFDHPGPLREDHRRLARSIGLLAGVELLPDPLDTSQASPLAISERLSDAIETIR